MQRLLALLFVLAAACNATEQIKDQLDAIDVERKPIDVTRMGVNAFGGDQEFGTVCEQYREVKNILGLRFVRVLFEWNDAVQQTADSEIFWGFTDEIIRCLPDGVDALVVVNGMPFWMYDAAYWPNGDPRAAWVERWFRKVVRRYGAEPRIVGFQVWNEPNVVENSDNQTLGFEDPTLYVEMLARAYSVSKDLAPGKLVLNAATTAVAQNYSVVLDYNKAMRDAGALNYVDRWAIHYYGKQFENLVRGVDGFLNDLGTPIWVTESGEQGVNNQLGYVEEVWPFLQERVPAIERFYYYEFTSNESPEESFGLRTLDPEYPVSDLYIHLKERNGS